MPKLSQTIKQCTNAVNIFLLDTTLNKSSTSVSLAPNMVPVLTRYFTKGGDGLGQSVSVNVGWAGRGARLAS